MTTDQFTLGGIVAGVMILFKLVDYMLSKAKENDLEKVTGLLSENLEVTNKLLTMHSVYDNDGVPMWYVPRSWASNQEKIAEICQEIAETQRSTVAILERMERNNE